MFVWRAYIITDHYCHGSHKQQQQQGYVGTSEIRVWERQVSTSKLASVRHQTQRNETKRNEKKTKRNEARDEGKTPAAVASIRWWQKKHEADESSSHRRRASCSSTGGNGGGGGAGGGAGRERCERLRHWRAAGVRLGEGVGGGDAGGGGASADRSGGGGDAACLCRHSWGTGGDERVRHVISIGKTSDPTTIQRY
jgi:hypothetical protein